MNETIPFIEKYRPKMVEDIKGQDIAVQEVRNFLRAFPAKRALILNGPTGTGKTSLILALALEHKRELFELNASDLRNRSSLDRILKPSLEQQSLTHKEKIILMDEADGITVTDYGGLPELLVLISKTHYPIIITANDIWQKKFSLLRQKCKIVNFKELSELTIKTILNGVIQKEEKSLRSETIGLIAKKARGDARACLNDLQSVIDFGEDEFIHELYEREKQETIFNTLKKLFQNKTDESILSLIDNLDLEMDEALLWIEENIPEEYKGIALYKAYDALSKADIFKGRIYRQQHWRFLVYENFFLTAGISAASRFKNNTFISYKRPTRVLKIFLANQKNHKKKSIVAKYAQFCHFSKKKAMRESFLLPLILSSLDKNAKKKLEFDETDEAFLEDKKGALIVSAGLNRFRI